MTLLLKLLILLVFLLIYGYAEVFKLRESGNQYTVEISQDNNVDIECQNNAIHVDELPHSVVNTISYLTIRNCELPNKSLQDIVEALGSSNVSVIQLIGVSLVKREHFERGSAKAIFITNSGVASDALKQQSQLEHINLNDLKLNLTETFLDGLTNLKLLVVNECQIPRIPQGMFKTTPKLQQLNLSKNLITDLTNSNFEDLNSLEYLFLNENKLESIPDNFLLVLPSHLRLYLNRNPLRELSANAFKGSRLIELNIEDNIVPLRLAPRALADMPQLQFVVLKNCSLNSVPEDLLKGSNDIYGIHLSHNNLKEIPKNFFKSKNYLLDLNLSNNRLSDSSLETLVHLTNLRKLNLDHNVITELTAGSFNFMSILTYLTLSNNKITVISPDALPATLRYINLENNQLTALETTVISELYYLRLENNSFSSLPSIWRDTFPSLTSLNLAHNSISELKESDFAAVPRCSDMNLTGNQIVSIVVRENTILPEVLSLTDAPLRCDCHLHAFATLFKNNYANTSVVCADPTSVKGRTLMNVELEELTCLSESCPNNCTCVIRPESKYLEVKCREHLTVGQFTALENFRQQHYSYMTQKTSVTYDV